MATAVASDGPASPIEYPILFSIAPEESPPSEAPRSVTLFNALSWLLPVYQLAGWLPKHMPRAEASGSGGHGDELDAEACETRALLVRFESFFTMEDKVIPNGALLYSVQSFRFPTPRGPRTISRAFVESPRLYFSPLSEEKGGGHFLRCYEDPQKLRRFTYVQLDQLRFAWVAVKELLDEHKALQRTDGSLTGLARRDIKKNNTDAPVTRSDSHANNGEATEAPPLVVRRPHPSSNVLTGPSAEDRRSRAELQEKKYMRDLLYDECAARWPHTPPHKAAVFTVAEQQAEVTGGRKGRKGPRAYLATVELSLLNKKGGAARFAGTRWCTSKQDAENAAAEVALRALRGTTS